jgi:hypothetical protein
MNVVARSALILDQMRTTMHNNISYFTATEPGLHLSALRPMREVTSMIEFRCANVPSKIRESGVNQDSRILQTTYAGPELNPLSSSIDTPKQ